MKYILRYSLICLLGLIFANSANAQQADCVNLTNYTELPIGISKQASINIFRKNNLANIGLEAAEAAVDSAAISAARSFDDPYLRNIFLQNLESARHGKINSMIAVSDNYFHGKGVRRNETEGFIWIKRAVELGSTEAMIALGNLYYSNSACILKNPTTGLYWKRKAAERGNSNAMLELGWTMMPNKEPQLLEDELSKNRSESIYWFKQAMEAKAIPASYNTNILNNPYEEAKHSLELLGLDCDLINRKSYCKPALTFEDIQKILEQINNRNTKPN